ncbi:MAG: tRNA epoxyqueuosine(34) reductase QueG [Flavobacteriales bacterium]|nr:tRNA epoxyqueuosine(34) reductase QueG [Flavobacteriales bacterium]
MGRTAHRGEERVKRIREWASELGFASVGISRAERLEEEEPRLTQWLAEGRHGKMSYMERNFDKRLDPRLLLPGTRTVISLMLNHYSEERPEDRDAPRISTYAYGEDYHYVMKWKLKELLKWMRRDWGEIAGRVYVDSAPILERAWAKRSGLGWVGKHGLILTKSGGSHFFLGEILVDLDLPPDAPVTDHCGTCTRCIDACPTGAIIQPQVLDGSRCISYFTIELRDDLPEPMAGKFENWMFGCDICQEVCPWNRHAEPHNEPAFDPSPELMKMTRRDWVDLKEETFNALFKKSPVKRTGYAGLQRNIAFVDKERKSDSGEPQSFS